MISLGLLSELERILGGAASQFAFSCKKDAGPIDMADKPPFDLMAKNSDGDTILHQLIIHGAEEAYVSSYLSTLSECELKEIINERNNNHQTALHISICEDMEEIVSTLIKHGASPVVKNDEGETGVYLAVKLGKNNCLRIMAANADPSILDIRCNCGKSPLHMAINTENMEAFDILLQKGVDVNLRNGQTGETPLHYAVKRQEEELLKKLLDLNGDVNAQTNAGDTPLHFINEAKHRDLAHLLLEKGANIHVRNNSNYSPHDLADKTLKRFLERNRKDRKTRRKKGQARAANAESSSKSSTEADEGESDVVVSRFVPFADVFAARGNKIARQNSNQLDVGVNAGSGTVDPCATSIADHYFQPELFNTLLSNLRPYEENHTDPLSSQSDDNGSAELSNAMLSVSEPTSKPSISLGGIDIPAVNTCGANSSEVKQQVASTLPMYPTTTTDAPLPHMVSQPTRQAFSDTFSTSAVPLSMMTVQQTLSEILPSPPTVVTTSIAHGTPPPLTPQNPFIHQPQQADQSNSILEFAQLALADSSILQQANSNSACISSTVASQNLDIEHAFQSAGLIDAESRSLALGMPVFIKKIQDIAGQLGLPPAEVLVRLLSPKLS